MSVYQACKDVLNLAQQMDNVPLQRALLDAMQQALEQQKRIQTLEEEVQFLSEQLAFRGRLIRWKDAYWETCENGRNGDPICTRCWDVEKRAVRLVTKREIHGRVFDECPQCKTKVDAHDRDRRGLPEDHPRKPFGPVRNIGDR